MTTLPHLGDLPNGTDAFDDDATNLICCALNNYRTGQCPYADAASLPFFTIPYTVECLDRAIPDCDPVKFPQYRAMLLEIRTTLASHDTPTGRG